MSSSNQMQWVDRLKPVVFFFCLLPFLYLVYRTFAGQLDAEPVKDITGVTGETGIRLLLLTLLVSPLRELTGINGMIRWRRMLGLFAFFYIALHFLTYLVLDQFFAWRYIFEDITDRPYILFGFTAFLLLIPLAVTSTNKMVRRLGGKRWKNLHRLVYLIAILAVLHHFLLVKADISGPLVHGLLLAVLLGYRLQQSRQLSYRKNGSAPTNCQPSQNNSPVGSKQ